MKRTIHSVLLLLAAIMAMSTVGCGKAKPTLYIYNWTYYIPDEILRDFEKETGTTVVYDMYASNEEMFTKLKGGATGYDIVVPSGDYVSIMAREGMLETIDKSKIPNFANIDTSILSRINFDKGCAVSVPYMMASSGVAVNKTKVTGYTHSWHIFERGDLAGKMTMLYDMREVLGAALKTLGYSVNSVDTAQINQARDLVIVWKKNLQKFDAEAFAKSFSAGEFTVVHGYAENVFKEYDSTKTDEVDFFIPEEGGPMYMDNLCILKGGKNKELAYRFINYVHRPDIYARICDYLMLPSLNTKARDIRKVKPKYEIADLKNSEFKEDLGPAVELYNKAWQQITIEN